MPEKTALRAELAERRATAAAAQPDAGEALIQHWPLPLARDVWVSGYVRFRSEIDPKPLMAHLAALGARLCLPCVGGGPLTFRAWSFGDALVKSRFGVLEPASDAAAVTPAIVLVPLLGFDRRGHRLGYGQGHYDRALEALRARGSVAAVGLAFAEQEKEALPAEVHDQRLDFVLTPRETIVCG